MNMKIKALFAFLFLTVALQAQTQQGQTVERLIEKYSTNKSFEYVSITKGLFNLTQWLGGNNIDQDTKEVLSRIKTLKILTLTTNNQSEVRKNFQIELDRILKRGIYEQMMVTRNKSDQSTVYGYTDSKGVSQLVIVAKNDDEMSVLVMKGNLTREDLEKIAK
jgi:hypothetical protein